MKILTNYNILFAYESVGDWGCDSSSYFLFKHKKTKKLFEIHGSHCSCYGFEGQFRLEYTGGYDNESDRHEKIATKFINKNL